MRLSITKKLLAPFVVTIVGVAGSLNFIAILPHGLTIVARRQPEEQR